MNTNEFHKILDIDPVMKRCEKRNVYALDEFLADDRINNEYYSISICNEQPSNMNGSHWFLIFCQGEELFFLDSLSRSPKFYDIENKLKKMRTTYVSLDYALQSPFSTVCGEYCIFFSYHLSRNKDLKEILKYFSYDREKNDELVAHFNAKKFPNYRKQNANGKVLFWMNQDKL